MRKNLLRLFLAAGLACFVLPGFASADTLQVTYLGAAANFAVLSSVGTETVNNSLVTINGNEGAIQGSKITNQAPSIVTGNVYVDTASQYSGPGIVDGSVIADTTLMGSSGTAQAGINNALSTISGLTFPSSSGNITSAATFNATGALTTVQVGNINLNNMNLTLNGTASDQFVVEVTGSLTLGGTASLTLTGGLTPSNVIWDFTNSSCSISTHVGDAVTGVLLGEGCTMNLDGTFNGELISDKNITLMSGAVVNQPASTVPEPASMSLLGMGLILVAGLSLRKKVVSF